MSISKSRYFVRSSLGLSSLVLSSGIIRFCFIQCQQVTAMKDLPPTRQGQVVVMVMHHCPASRFWLWLLIENKYYNAVCFIVHCMKFHIRWWYFRSVLPSYAHHPLQPAPPHPSDTTAVITSNSVKVKSNATACIISRKLHWYCHNWCWPVTGHTAVLYICRNNITSKLRSKGSAKVTVVQLMYTSI